MGHAPKYHALSRPAHLLVERERQLVLEVLRLYRDGGNFDTLGNKIGELRAVRRQLSETRSPDSH